MKTLFRKLVLGTILAASAALLGPGSVQADDYWDNHWRWYDNSYRPYYQRQYYNGPYNGPYNAPYNAPYNRSYYGNGYRSYSYGTAPYYYGNGYYNGTTYYPSSGVQVGPLRFGWW